jgi:hypothetical protein
MGPPDLDTFRSELATLMADAARQAKVDLLPNGIAFSFQSDCVVVNELIAPPENVPIEEADKLFLHHLSFPQDNDRWSPLSLRIKSPDRPDGIADAAPAPARN